MNLVEKAKLLQEPRNGNRVSIAKRFTFSERLDLAIAVLRGEVLAYKAADVLGVQPQIMPAEIYGVLKQSIQEGLIEIVRKHAE